MSPIPDASAQMRSAPYRIPVHQGREAMQKRLAKSGKDWQPGGRHFEKARAIVARKLKWKPINVLNWEVVSYLRLDAPAWATREGLAEEDA